MAEQSIQNMNIPFLNFKATHDPIEYELKAAFNRVYESQWFIMGKEVDQFEQAYAHFNQTAHCIAVSNGLDALHLSLKALGIGVGDEVIVPSNTFIATLLAVSYVGATPVLVEPCMKTYNLDPANIEKAITSKTRAIMPVHLYGQACQMDAIMEIAQRHKLFVIEDNAQSQGATFRGRITGSFGHLNGTSFYPGKNLGALGDAGAVTTADPLLAEKVKTLSNYGTKVKYVNEEIGFNMRMDEIQAAFLRVKLSCLNQWIQQRQQIAQWYNERLAGIEGCTLPEVHPDATHTYHLYVIRVEQRDALQQHLNENGIGTLIHYPIPPHLQKAYQSLGFKSGDFSIAETIANTCLSLPIWPGMTESQVDQVAEQIQLFLSK
jgi:dTDP-4-amino-4,6-dideoxygalactose transaminase